MTSTTENLHHILEAHFPDSSHREAIAAAARSLTDTTARLATEGKEPSEAWLHQIPVPDPDNEDQQTHWRQLVTAVAVWRMAHPTNSSTPMGDRPDDADLGRQWTELHNRRDALPTVTHPAAPDRDALAMEYRSYSPGADPGRDATTRLPEV